MLGDNRSKIIIDPPNFDRSHAEWDHATLVYSLLLNMQYPLSHNTAVWACLMVLSLDKSSVPNLIPHELKIHS